MTKLLLVEDNEDHATLTMIALKEQNHNHTIFWVKDGKEAIDFIYNRNEYEDKEKYPPPDYIILDIKMPRINGFEVLKTLKEDPIYKEIPIIMLTTSEYEEDIKRSYQLGANSFVTKTMRTDEFMSKVKSLESYWTKTNSVGKR